MTLVLQMRKLKLKVVQPPSLGGQRCLIALVLPATCSG